MVKLILDAGNTSLKAAFWEDKNTAKMFGHTTLKALSAKRVLKKFGMPEALILSSVINQKLDLKKYFPEVQTVLKLNHNTPVPVIVKYKTLKTLGNDRLANAVGGSTTFPGSPVLIIDAGTCLKFDFVDNKANYLGGSIAPGLNMRFDALNQFTSRLPKLKMKPNVKLIGQTTEESIRAGVQNGILAETEGLIDQYLNKYKNLKIIITGGDYRFFAGNLKKHIFVAPNLTLMGLNEILDYNTI